jgi:hypothetical protein
VTFVVAWQRVEQVIGLAGCLAPCPGQVHLAEHGQLKDACRYAHQAQRYANGIPARR